MKGSIRLRFALIISLFSLLSISANKNPLSREDYRRERELFAKASYTSVQISYGETLEDIALRYNTSSLSQEEYIRRLRELNDLLGNELRPGCYLSVIVFPEGE